jgi:hypothetical protein
MEVDGGLTVNAEGSLQLEEKLPTPPTSYLYGPNGWVGVGAGLSIDAGGNLIISCDLPPYGCRTDVNPYCVFNFGNAWASCTSLTSFPLINTSSGINFSGTWFNCQNLTSFPLLDTSNGTSFTATWSDCFNLASFPLLDTSAGTNFAYTWANCRSLVSFPLLDTSSGISFNYAWFNCFDLTSFPLLNVRNGTNFLGAWFNCTGLTSFPAGMFNSCLATNFTNAWYNCALSQQSVDNILVSLDTAGRSNGTVSINGGTSAAPSATGLAAKASLQARGWTVTTN